MKMLGGKLSEGKKCVKSSGMRITGTKLIGWTQKLQRQGGRHIVSMEGISILCVKMTYWLLFQLNLSQALFFNKCWQLHPKKMQIFFGMLQTSVDDANIHWWCKYVLVMQIFIGEVNKTCFDDAILQCQGNVHQIEHPC